MLWKSNWIAGRHTKSISQYLVNLRIKVKLCNRGFLSNLRTDVGQWTEKTSENGITKKGNTHMQVCIRVHTYTPHFQRFIITRKAYMYILLIIFRDKPSTFSFSIDLVIRISSVVSSINYQENTPSRIYSFS